MGKSRVTIGKVIQLLYFAGNTAFVLMAAFFTMNGYGNKTIVDTYQTLPYDFTMQMLIICLLAMVIAGVLFLLLKRVDKLQIIRQINAYTFMLYYVSFISYGKVENKYVLLFFGMSFLGALVMTLLLKKEFGKEKCCDKTDIKNAFPLVTLWAVMVWISIPVELYVNNPGDFQFLFWRYCMILILGAGCYTLLSFAGCFFLLNQTETKLLCMITFAVAVMGYIQSMVLNRGLNVLTGDAQSWEMKSILVNTGIWMIGMAVILHLGMKKEKIRSLYKVLSIYIILIQMVTTGYLMVTGNTNSDAAFKAFTNKGSLEISENNNVFVFVLDRFDAELFETLYADEEAFLEPLQDFTFYPDSTGMFSRTSTAIPYLLTGTAYADYLDEGEYPEYAYANSDVLNTIAENGFRIGIYTKEDLVLEQYRDVAYNYDDDIDKKCGIIDTIFTMMKCSKYRMAPLVLKNSFSYYTSEITDLISNKEIWNIDNDLPFYENLVSNGLVLEEKESKGAYFFFHLFGTHGPTNLSENMRNVESGSITLEEQARASLKIIYEYMEQLKALGKYEDATIIITADHGMQLDDDSFKDNGVVDRTTRPVVLVKNAKDSHDKLQIVEKPVSQQEFIPTVLEALKINQDYGKTYAEIPEDSNSVRVYASIWGSKIDIYEIIGNAKEKNNWLQVYSNYE